MNFVRGLVNLISALPISTGPLIVLPCAAATAAVLSMFGWDLWIWIMLASVLVAGVWAVIDLIKRRRQSKQAAGLFSEGAAAPMPVQKDMAETYTQLRQKFQERVKTLRNCDRTLYSQPWYLLIGEPGCGKSQSLIQSELDFPLGKEELAGFGGTINYNFWIHAKAVVLDTAGRLTFHQEGVKDRREWEYLLGLLKKYRSAAPMNGVVVAVSAESLFEAQVEVDGPDGPEKVWKPVLSTDRVAKAEILRDRLRQLQKELKIRFPVWLVITKADLIPGFTQFFHHVPPYKCFQMLGWARPGDYQLPYNPEEFPAHFEGFCQHLRLWGHRFLNEQGLWPGQSEENWLVMRFSEELRIRSTALSDYVNTLFQPNELVQPPFFRGFFFTSSMLVGAPRSGLPFRPDMAEIGSREESFPDAETPRDKTAVSYFLKDLYEEKVFPERGLLLPSENREARLRKSKRHVLTVGTIMVGAMLGVVACMLFKVAGVINAAERNARDAYIFTHNAVKPPSWVTQRGQEAWKIDQPNPLDNSKPPKTLAGLRTAQDEFQKISIKMLGWLTPGVSADDVRNNLETIRRELFLSRVLPYNLSRVELGLIEAGFDSILAKAVEQKAEGLELGDASQEPVVKELAEYLRWYALARGNGWDANATSQPDYANAAAVLLAASEKTRGQDLEPYSGYLQEVTSRSELMAGLFAPRWWCPQRLGPEKVIESALEHLSAALRDYADLNRPAGLLAWHTLIDDAADAGRSWRALDELCNTLKTVQSVEDYDGIANQWWKLAVPLADLKRQAADRRFKSDPQKVLLQKIIKDLEKVPADLKHEVTVVSRLFQTVNGTLPVLPEAVAGAKDQPTRKYSEVVRQLGDVVALEKKFKLAAALYEEHGQRHTDFKAFCDVAPEPRPAKPGQKAAPKPDDALAKAQSTVGYLQKAIHDTAQQFDTAQFPVSLVGKLGAWSDELERLMKTVAPSPAGGLVSTANTSGGGAAAGEEDDNSPGAECRTALRIASSRYQATRRLLAIRERIAASATQPAGVASCCVVDESSDSSAPVQCRREHMKSVVDQLLDLEKKLSQANVPPPPPGAEPTPSPLLASGPETPNGLVATTRELLWKQPWTQYLGFYFNEWTKWYENTGNELEKFRTQLAAKRQWTEWYQEFDLEGAGMGERALENLRSMLTNVGRAEEPLKATPGGPDVYKPARDALIAARSKSFGALTTWVTRTSLPLQAEQDLNKLLTEWGNLVSLLLKVKSYLEDHKLPRPQQVATALDSFESTARVLHFAEVPKQNSRELYEPQYVERLIRIARDAKSKLEVQLDSESAAQLKPFQAKQYPFSGAEPGPGTAETRIDWNIAKPAMVETDAASAVSVGSFWTFLGQVSAFEERYKDFPASEARNRFRDGCGAWREFLMVKPDAPKPAEPGKPVEPQLRPDFKIAAAGYERIPQAGIENAYTHLEFAGLLPNKEESAQNPAPASLSLASESQTGTEGWLPLNSSSMSGTEIRLTDGRSQNPQLLLFKGPANPMAFFWYMTTCGSSKPGENLYFIRYTEGNTPKITVKIALDSNLNVPERIPWLSDPLAAPIKSEDGGQK